MWPSLSLRKNSNYDSLNLLSLSSQYRRKDGEQAAEKWNTNNKETLTCFPWIIPFHLQHTLLTLLLLASFAFGPVHRDSLTATHYYQLGRATLSNPHTYTQHTDSLPYIHPNDETYRHKIKSLYIIKKCTHTPALEGEIPSAQSSSSSYTLGSYKNNPLRCEHHDEPCSPSRRHHVTSYTFTNTIPCHYTPLTLPFTILRFSN